MHRSSPEIFLVTNTRHTGSRLQKRQRLVNRVFRCHGYDIQKEFIQGLTPSSLSCKPDTCGYIYEIPKKKKLSNTKHALFFPNERTIEAEVNIVQKIHQKA